MMLQGQHLTDIKVEELNVCPLYVVRDSVRILVFVI